MFLPWEFQELEKSLSIAPGQILPGEMEPLVIIQPKYNRLPTYQHKHRTV